VEKEFQDHLKGKPMSITVELPDEIYTRLEQQARARGLTVSQTIAQFIEEAEKARIAMAIERLQAKGLLLVPAEPLQSAPADLKPIHVQGQPLSEVIIEERR
jgi:predicted transcriptional regulator